MKKILTIIFVLISVFGFGQINPAQFSIVNITESLYSGTDYWITAHPDSANQYIYHNMANPTDPLQGANKRYVDSTVIAVGAHDPVTLDAVALNNGFSLNSQEIEFDSTNYTFRSDSMEVFVTPTQLTDSLDVIRTSISAIASSYTITLPINGTLSGSVAAAVEGTDYPKGWVLAASGGNLQINHGLGKYPNMPIVKYNSTGSTYRQLRSFDNAYSGVLEVDDDNITIESISTFYTAYKLKIKISF